MNQSPDDLVALNTYANEFTAGVVRAKLEDAGIPAQAITSSGALIGVFAQTGWLPFTVWVRKVDEERAIAVLQTVQLEQGTVDWDVVDVGEPEPGDRAAVEAANDTNPPVSKHKRLGMASGLLIGAAVMWTAGAVIGGGIPWIGGLIGLAGLVCFLWATTIAFGVFFMSRTKGK